MKLEVPLFGMVLPSEYKDALSKEVATPEKSSSNLSTGVKGVKNVSSPSVEISTEALLSQMFKANNNATVKALVIDKLLAPEGGKSDPVKKAQQVLQALRVYLINNPEKVKQLDAPFVRDLMKTAFEENMPSSIVSEYTPHVFSPDLETEYLEALLKKTTSHQVLFNQLHVLKKTDLLNSPQAEAIHKRLAELEVVRGAGAYWAEGEILSRYRKEGITPPDSVLALLLEKTKNYERLAKRYDVPMFDEPQESQFLKTAVAKTTSLDFMMDILLLETEQCAEERTDLYLKTLEALQKRVNMMELAHPEGLNWPWDKALRVLSVLDQSTVNVDDEMLLKPLLTLVQLPDEEKQTLKEAFSQTKRKSARLSEVKEMIKQATLQREKEAAFTNQEAKAPQISKNPFKSLIAYARSLGNAGNKKDEV